jgi:hypothetical protein
LNSLPTQGWFVLNLFKIGPEVLEKTNMYKFTDKGQSETLTWPFSSGELLIYSMTLLNISFKMASALLCYLHIKIHMKF